MGEFQQCWRRLSSIGEESVAFFSNFWSKNTPEYYLSLLSHLYLSLLSHPFVRLVCALQKNKITTKKKATSTAHYILPDTSLLGYRWERIQTNACRARNSQSTIYCSTHTRVTLIQYHIPSHPIYHIMYHTIYHTI